MLKGLFRGRYDAEGMIAILLANSPRSPLGNINIFSGTPKRSKLRYFSPVQAATVVFQTQRSTTLQLFPRGILWAFCYNHTTLHFEIV